MALVAQYIFNDNANDSSGNGNNGTPANVTYEAKPAGFFFDGKVALFNGSNSKIDLPSISAITGTNTRTIMCWMYTATTLTCFFSSGNSSNYANYWRVNTNIVRAGSLNANADSSSGVPDNTWTHVAITLSSNNSSAFKFYINGSEVSRNTSTDTINTSNDNIAIGYIRNIANYYFNGKLADLRLYSGALSSSEILDIYNKATKSATGNFIPFFV